MMYVVFKCFIIIYALSTKPYMVLFEGQKELTSIGDIYQWVKQQI